ncbi:hypothetical protein [Salsipaludibacter albus]|uniref:hypothetical protein n=1 Tax=Salsipaludibacter albus TaxID=2849650 RepID=UPI001EE4A88C|nr:hypothetical protein [Salsipaludibacter albus]MBY5162087.1 hypothetical protein [Salsipaludibacter albus]
MTSPLFSTYRQGENRVSASTLAVFERLGIDLVGRILGAALEQPEMELVAYKTQPSRGGAGVPDGEMTANFRFLFEVKTQRGGITTPAHVHQLRRHLDRLDGAHSPEAVIALTPDADRPSILADVEDDRLVWTNFEALTQAIEEVLADPAEPASERQRFLLRELTDLFVLDGLVGGDDVVVVAASSAYRIWRDHGAYVCQADRAIRPVEHWGFYRSKQIEPEFPRVRKSFPRVEFSAENAGQLREDPDPDVRELADLMHELLDAGLQVDGAQKDVYLLQRKDDPGLSHRDSPILHDSKGAWTQYQRYGRLDQLLEVETTSEL